MQRRILHLQQENDYISGDFVKTQSEVNHENGKYYRLHTGSDNFSKQEKLTEMLNNEIPCSNAQKMAV